MGSDPRAHLAYGYYLGDDNQLEVRERAREFGTDLNVDWYPIVADAEDHIPTDDEIADNYSFAEQLTERLATTSPAGTDWREHYGVELRQSGAEDSEGYLLVVAGSHRSVEWSETMALDPFLLQREPIDEGWDGKLEAALTALGITPTQGGPCWLVYPSYG